MNRGAVRGTSGHQVLSLSEGWELAIAPPGSDAPPTDGWRACTVPATAASVLRAHGEPIQEREGEWFDERDFWWRLRFHPPAGREGETFLCLGGIATVADVFLNGALLTSASNMFVAHENAVALAADNELLIHCKALAPLLKQKRPRPRWKAAMVRDQQLRWIRTSLLGRTPGWTPPFAPVGPWRPVTLETRHGLRLSETHLHATVEVASRRGRVELRGVLAGKTLPSSITLGVEAASHGGAVGSASADAEVRSDGTFTAVVEIAAVALWWPHTHGPSPLYAVTVQAGEQRFDLGRVGFRRLELDRANGDFALRINDAPVFCRGAVWTPLDVASLQASAEELARALDQVTAAGMNMLRVAGPLVYESDAFHEACDERGILVWQELMFANLDYPDDPTFVASVTREVTEELGRRASRPSLAVICGNSEVEQQAAMWGAPAELWSPPLFHQTIAALAAELAPSTPYWPSSAHGGSVPHQPRVGTTSYYGVGAYLRDTDDARRSEVRFATECLAFANVPHERDLPGGRTARVHQAAWKRRTPRDLGAGWDFDDVRDHYVGRFYGVDPAALRYADHDRYLALGRAASGEAMHAAFSEWRRAGSRCRGALVLFFQDLWTSAGWGVVDASGRPKVAYDYLRRALQPLHVSVSDEGLNGFVVHVVHEGAEPRDVELELVAYRRGQIEVARAVRPLALAPRSAVSIDAWDLFGHFGDHTFAYRFGAPTCDVVVATVRGVEGEPHPLLAQAFQFVGALPSERELDLGLEATLVAEGDRLALRLTTRRLALTVDIEMEGAEPDDNHFHLAPGGERTLHLRRIPSTRPLGGTVHPLNAERATRIAVPAPPASS